MRKAIFIILTTAAIPTTSWSLENCTATENVVVSYSATHSCKPGYYLSNGTCLECPERRDDKGNIINPGITSADKNTVGITACYQQTGGTYEYSDNTGTFILSGTGKCSHN
jgi:hypothetical protein